MSQLSPKQIILHCGLHKTGTTYLQRNLQSNQDELLELGILYLGPTTFKNQWKELWKYIEFGQNNPPIEKIKAQTLTTLTNLAKNKPEKVDVILISFESIFGTLSKGLIADKRHKGRKKENKAGLYRYARKRVKRLINSLEKALSNAVHRQLMSDVPYGVLLSGGLDSSITSALAKKFASKRVESNDTKGAWWPQ